MSGGKTETHVAAVAWESRAGQGQALRGSMLCYACFAKQPYLHLGHPWASDEKAASFAMRGMSLGLSGMFLIANSPAPACGVGILSPAELQASYLLW